LIYSPVVPAFTYVAGQTYFTEMFHHAMLKNLEALSDGGASLVFSTEAELQSQDAAFASWMSSSASWIEGITEKGYTGALSDVPAIPSPGDVDRYDGGWKAILLQIGVRLVGYLIQHYLEKWLDPDESSVDFSALVARLEEIRLGLAGEYDENLTEGMLQKLEDLKSEIDVMMSSFRLELDLESSQKSAAVSFTGVLAQELPS